MTVTPVFEGSVAPYPTVNKQVGALYINNASSFNPPAIYLQTSTSPSWRQLTYIMVTMGYFQSSAPSSSQVIGMYNVPISQGFTIDVDVASNIVQTATTQPTNPFTVSVQKNGTEFLTLLYQPGGPNGYALISAETFTGGDVITFVAPSAIDLTINGFGATIPVRVD